MEVKRESVIRNNILLYLGFIWNYKKKEEEKEKGNMDERFAKREREVKGAYNNIISDHHHFHWKNLIGTDSVLW